jgi:cobalt-zinc-cadmium efflux system outer membrane protein
MKKTNSGLSCLLGLLFMLMHLSVHAQDTIHINLAEAENLFFNRNLSILAEKYNVSVAEAQVIQAKLHINPNFQFTGNIYNPIQRKFFDVSNQTGEYIVGAQQLILLAGKRNKQIQLAQTNVALAENRLFDLLRTLRFTLRSDFYQAYFLQNSINAYQTQITALDSLNSSYKILLDKGAVTLKEAVRIQALLYSLRAEQTSLQNQFNDAEAEIQLLLQNNKTWIIPVSDINAAGISPINGIALTSLIDTAYANRYDLKLAQNNLLYDQRNYNLQKAIAVPDLTLGASFDKRGSFVESASFFNVAIDLPFFNRNQGNIKAAKTSIEQSKVQLNQQSFVVENDVQKAYSKAINTDRMLASIDPTFRSSFQLLLTSITENFRKRNISLLEFTDFYESYKQNTLQINQLQNDRMQAIENLNFAVGKTIINY